MYTHAAMSASDDFYVICTYADLVKHRSKHYSIVR